jgi:hypothetical protein
MTGLKLEEIDHIVMGMKVAERALPRMVWIVQSLKPMDRTKVQAALKAARGPDSLRWAGPQTLILAAGPKDLEAVPAEPGAGIGHLPAPLQAFLLERLGKVAQAWVVGSAADWKKTALFFLLKDLPAEEQQVLANVHTLGVWLQCEQGLVLNGAAQCADEPAAQALNKYLDRWHKDNFKHFQQETWVTAQARGSVQAMEQTFAGHGKAK